MIGYNVTFCIEPRSVRRNGAGTSPSPSHFCLLPSAFCLSYLSPLCPIRSALFCAMEPLQALSHQSLPHPFSSNGGWGGMVANRSSLPTTHHLLFSTTYSNQIL